MGLQTGVADGASVVSTCRSPQILVAALLPNAQSTLNPKPYKAAKALGDARAELSVAMRSMPADENPPVEYQP